MNSNLGLIYYKTLFNNYLNFDNFKPVFKPTIDNLKTDLFDLGFEKVGLSLDSYATDHFSSFYLATIYPGLLIGSGYSHEIGGEKVNGKLTVENELKLGFFFDHTTGLPCIPGSSVKGVIRSAFEKDNGNYINYIINELAEGKRKSEVEDSARRFDKSLVLAQDSGKKDKHGNIIFSDSEFIKKIFNGENVPAYERDIFFDAFPISSANNEQLFLSNDYITHHENPLKNPIPIQYLKVLPGVTFKFDFKLTDLVMNANLKLELFRQILLDTGIGAKTNVGYGQFKEVITQPLNKKEEFERVTLDDIIPKKAIPFLRNESSFQGEMIDQIGLYNIYSFLAGAAECVLKKRSIKNPNLKIGDAVTIIFKHDYQEGNPNFQVK